MKNHFRENHDRKAVAVSHKKYFQFDSKFHSLFKCISKTSLFEFFSGVNIVMDPNLLPSNAYIPYVPWHISSGPFVYIAPPPHSVNSSKLKCLVPPEVYIWIQTNIYIYIYLKF